MASKNSLKMVVQSMNSSDGPQKRREQQWYIQFFYIYEKKKERKYIKFWRAPPSLKWIETDLDPMSPALSLFGIKESLLLPMV